MTYIQIFFVQSVFKKKQRLCFVNYSFQFERNDVIGGNRETNLKEADSINYKLKSFNIDFIQLLSLVFFFLNFG